MAPSDYPTPTLKLGKAPAQRNVRGFKFRPLLRGTGPLPPAYDFDSKHPGIPTPMFANDRYLNCVIAAQAHQTMRFEVLEQNRILTITDDDVNREYFHQTGGVANDDGLSVINALEQWHTAGWKVEGSTYLISAYTSLNYLDFEELRQAVFADVGVGLGVQMPLSARQQLDTRQPWTVATGPTADRGSWGGHYVYVCGYTPDGPVCITWGRKQRMSWDWLATYADEAYAIFDARNLFKKDLVDVAQLQKVVASFS